MKTLKYINHSFFGILIIGGVGSLFFSELLLFLAIGIFFFGVFQAFFGIILFLAYPKNISYQIYTVGLLGFALICLLRHEWLWLIPPIPLALYFTYILHHPVKSVRYVS